MRIGQTTAIVFLSKIATSVLGFIATIYFARVLGAEVLGYYAAILAVASWLKLPANIGVSKSVTKRVSEGKERSQFFTAGLIAVFTLGIIASGGAWIFRDQLNAYVGTEAALFIIVIVLTYLYLSIVKSTLSGERLVHLSEILNTTKVGLRSTLQITLVFAGFGLVGMIAGYITAAFVVAAIGTILISSSLAQPKYRHFRSLFDFAKYAWLGSMRSKSFNNVDVIVLTAMVNPALVGIYSVAWGIANLLNTFGAAIRRTVFPEISKANEEADELFISHVTNDAITYSGLIAIPGLFGGILVGERLLTLYGDEFREGALVLALLILTVLIYEYYKQMVNVLNAVDRPDIAFRVNAVFVGGNAILNVVFIYIIGWVGAAVATVTAATIGLLLAYNAVTELIPLQIPFGELGRQTSAAVTMSGAVIGLEHLLTNVATVTHNLFILLVLVSTGAIVYFITLFGLSKQFREIVSTNLPFQIPIFTS